MDAFIELSLSNQFSFILNLIENLDNDFLNKRHNPEKWSIQEHLAHLGRYQEIFLLRIAVILEEEVPILDRYVADKDDGFYKWCALTKDEIIIKATTTRKEIIRLLKQLSPDQMLKTGIHPKLGSMNIVEWTSFFILHESHHIYAIFGLKQSFS